MGLSFRKRMSLSTQILAAVEESIELQGKHKDLFEQLNDASKELSDSTQKLLALHKKLMDDGKVPDELQVTEGAVLQVVTSHGNYVVGSECPEHKRVHNSHGWYICVDGGFINVNGWVPSSERKI